jgi:hypothetical protein
VRDRRAGNKFRWNGRQKRRRHRLRGPGEGRRANGWLRIFLFDRFALVWGGNLLPRTLKLRELGGCVYPDFTAKQERG